MQTFDRSTTVEWARTTLAEGKAQIREDFFAGKAGGHATTDALAILMDETLQSIWHEVGGSLGVDLADHLALLAVGGYGRGQLAPHSDIDLLFLRVSNETALQDKAVEEILYVLWDLNLKVGQAVRTPAECLRLGAEDFTILTSLIEMRLIRGSRSGFTALRKAVDKRLLTPRRRAFVTAKMAEREARHERHGQSRYVLEPNVKENKGGLRDLHALSWISRAVFGDGQVETLMSHGVFSLAQARAYEAAEAFLLSVRVHLHYLADRAEERLSFDAQLEIAAALGYEGQAPSKGVEAFMQDYFRAAKEVGNLTGIIIATIEEEFAGQNRGLRRAWRQRVETCQGFSLVAGRLAIPGAQQLVAQPLDFLRYFLVAHEQGLVHAPSTLRLLTQNLRLIDEELQSSAEANALFLKLLTHEKNPTLSLRTMNETGVLSAFLPEWASIVGRMQFNRYHHYTVDEHTLHAIDQLHQLKVSGLGDVTEPVHQVMGQIEDPVVLFVAMLYHDIAKGRPGRHEVEGAKLAPAICSRLGLSPDQAEQVRWLILEHLSLSDAAFQRDADVPETQQGIAEMAESVDSLRLLYVLTTADVRAVGPDTWSAWKGALLQRAYVGAGEILRSGEVGQGAVQAADARRRAVAEALSDRPAEDLAAYLNAATQAYWLAYDTDDCQGHFDLFTRAPDFEIKNLKQRKAIALTICTDDTPGLFARLAGAVTLAGWNVQASKAHTLKNGLALDTLYMRKAGKAGAIKTDLAKLEDILPEALSGRLTLKDMAARLPRKRSKRERAMDRPATVRIHTPETLNSPTIIEVAGPDRHALLFDLTATIMQLGMILTSVRVATYGERFVNVFYVTDLMGQRLEGEDRLERAKAALLKAAEGDIAL